MARIAGVDLPRDKRVEIGLTYIYGIGRVSATKILEAAGVNPDTRCRDLTDEEVKQMAHGCSYEGTRTIGSFKVCDENDIYEIYKLANK